MQHKWRVHITIDDIITFSIPITAAHPATAIDRGYDKALARLYKLSDDVSIKPHEIKVEAKMIEP